MGHTYMLHDVAKKNKSIKHNIKNIYDNWAKFDIAEASESVVDEDTV